MQPKIKLTLLEASRLNRHERRALGKINNIKIAGSVKPFINKKK